MKHKIITLVLILLLSSLIVNAYTGVSDWAGAEISSAEGNGIIPASFDAKNFSESINREDFAEICVVLYEKISGEIAVMPENLHFLDTDIPTTAKAYELGVINGVTETTFEPYSLVTREQAASMLKRVLAKCGFEIASDVSGGFADDTAISDWAKADVYAMNKMGLIKGNENGRFEPKNNISIQEALIIANRAYIKDKAEAEKDKQPAEKKNLIDLIPIISFGTEAEREINETSATITIKDATLDNFKLYIEDVQRLGYNNVVNLLPDTFIIANDGTNTINVRYGSGTLVVTISKGTNQ